MNTTTPLTVRSRRPADLPELGAILSRVHDVDGYPVEGVSDPQGWLHPPHENAAWTALWHSHPIGHVSLTNATHDDDAARLWVNETNGCLDDIALVVRLFVDPTYRGHGAGQQLMRAAHEHAADSGKRLVFDVMLKDQRAIRLYEALGCELLGSITHRHGDGLEEPAAAYLAPIRAPG